jgi:hypothetical protein
MCCIKWRCLMYRLCSSLLSVMNFWAQVACRTLMGTFWQSWARVLRDHGPLDSVLAGHFPLWVGSLITPSPLPHVVQVSPDPCHYQWGSTGIPLPLQDTACGALGPWLHLMRTGCPAPRCTHLWYWQWIPRFSMCAGLESSVRKTSLKMERASPDTVWSV